VRRAGTRGGGLRAVAAMVMGAVLSSTVVVGATVTSPSSASAAPAFSSADVVDEFVAGPGYGIIAAAWMSDGRMLAAELFGGVYVINPATGVSTRYFDVPNLFQGGEAGLLDVAVDPNFATNHYFYLYNSTTAQKLEISRYVFSATGPQTLATRTVIWTNPGPGFVYSYHIGGSINFGPDGKLYVSIGENTVAPNSQDLTNVFGKILRINPDGTVPTDNPFYDGAGPHVDEIWAYGLRNPYRTSFDFETGQYYVGDVGGNDQATAYEEIDIVSAGKNYGWPSCEGPLGPPKVGSTCPAGVTGPLYSYQHLPDANGQNPSRAVVGGVVYRGASFPASFRGTYVYADYAKGDIYWLEQGAGGATSGVFKTVTSSTTPINPVWVDVSPFDGNIYWLGLEQNYGTQLRRLRYNGSSASPPVIQSSSATPALGALGTPTSFTASATDANGDAISYVWDFGDGSTGTGAQATHTYAAAGSYSARVTVTAGVDVVRGQAITVQIGNRPVPSLVRPAGGTTFRAGTQITLTASATDAEDGTVPANRLAWTVVFRHDNHTHPVSTGTGTSVVIPVPTSGHDFSGDTGYVVTLVATDSTGLTGTTSFDLQPEKVLVPVTSNIAVDVTIDGIVRPTPTNIDTILGFQHAVSVPTPVCIGTTSWAFASWSDGGARSHTVTIAAAPVTLTATYAAAGSCGTPTPPTAPTGLTANANGSTVTLAWTDTSNNETGFDIDRARFVAGTWTEWTSTTQPAGATSATFSSVPNGEYAYLVRARNGTLTSEWALAQVTVSTATASPAAPTNLAVSVTAGTAHLSWTDVATNELGYDVMRARNVAGVWSEWTSFVADINAQAFSDTPAFDGFYAYLVRARNPIGNSTWVIVVTDVSTTNAAPATPTSLVITPTGGRANLSWTDAANNETSFEVERARYVAGTWSEWSSFVVDRNVTTASDQPGADGMYAYLVRASNGVGASPWLVAVTTISTATAAPSAPTALVATPTGNQVALSWTDSSSGVNGELWFEVQRAQLVAGQYTNWTSVLADRNATGLTDSGVAAGSYAYLVRAHNAIADSGWAVVTTVVP